MSVHSTNGAAYPADARGMQHRLGGVAERLREAELTRRLGLVRALRGLAIEADGPPARVGELCAVIARGEPIAADLRGRLLDDTHGYGISPQAARRSRTVLAEVVAIHHGRVTLMPYGSVQGLSVGSTVVSLGDFSRLAVGPALLGRVIDGLGRPLDGGPMPHAESSVPLNGHRINPMQRPRIDTVLETGIRSIDALLTLGHGQRVGIFAGSGVGKSTLLGMIARHVNADVNVIALIGERGREVREFVEKQLGPQGLARSVVVVASADQPAAARIRAAHAALAIAEHFRDQGQHVLLTMDSITRLAMARREVGLSAGEPPTARGYPPSVFAELPELCERCGTAPSGGSITALLTVLVEGDDFNEPVSDALRAILDGHIVLSRSLAHQGQFPAIDVLKSASRLLPDLSTAAERATIHEAVRVLALLDRNRQMIELGAYEHGSNPELDAALVSQPALHDWLRQPDGGVRRADAMDRLREWHEALRVASSRSSAPSRPAGHTAPASRAAPRAAAETPRQAGPTRKAA